MLLFLKKKIKLEMIDRKMSIVAWIQNLFIA